MHARTEQSLLFDLLKAFDKIRSSHKSDFSLSHLFSLICAQHILSYHLIYIPWVLIFSCNTFCTSVHCLLDKLLNFVTLLNAFSYSNFLEHHFQRSILDIGLYVWASVCPSSHDFTLNIKGLLDYRTTKWRIYAVFFSGSPIVQYPLI